MTTLEQIKEFSDSEIQVTGNTIKKILSKNPPKSLLEKIGDQELKSVIHDKRSECEGSDTFFGIYSSYEQMGGVSQLLRAAVCYKMALKKRTSSARRKDSPKKKINKIMVSKRGKTKTNRAKVRN